MSVRDKEHECTEIRDWLALEEEVLAQERINQMISRAKEIAASVGRKYCAGVYLFGSLVKNRVHDHSDIDLLICGSLSESQKREIVLEIENLAKPYPVDVLFADEVSEQMRRAIMERGVKLTC